MPATRGRRLPGGIPGKPADQAQGVVRYVVGRKPLKVGQRCLKPGTPMPADLLARISRIESWVQQGRIKVVTTPLVPDETQYLGWLEKVVRFPGHAVTVDPEPS